MFYKLSFCRASNLGKSRANQIKTGPAEYIGVGVAGAIGPGPLRFLDLPPVLLGIELFTNPRRYVNTLRIKKIPLNSYLDKKWLQTWKRSMCIIILKFITHQASKNEWYKIWTSLSYRQCTSLNILQNGCLFIRNSLNFCSTRIILVWRLI